MRHVSTPAVCAAATLALLGGAAPALALPGEPGGVQAPSAPPAAELRPALGSLSVPRTASAGRPPRVTLRIDEATVATVYVQVTVSVLSSHRPVVVVCLGWVRTGRTVTVGWPPSATLAPGVYQVSVSARDHRGATLGRTAHSANDATVTIDAVPPAKAPTPPSAPSTPAEAGVLTPAQTVAAGAVFPVAGPHNFGGPENVFGAPRDGYLHQGQDVLTAEGTPIVAPFAGMILTTSYQAQGAGYYAVEQTNVGFDFMFAHCQASSLAVSTAELVSGGQALCRAGQTGDATAPHLDFEMWVGGWQTATGHPINPLPYLEAWER